LVLLLIHLTVTKEWPAAAALTGVALSIQKIIDINGKLSDAQSDVMKTTGMTKDEVDELTKSFGLLHTFF
jgi:tubulin-specific chaperone A